jgi:CBS-domain-containing membrane protein
MATARDIMTGGAECVSVQEALRTMKEHGVRRLPVIDGHDLIGIVSQADVARNLPEDKIRDLVEAISSAPLNS